LVIDSGAEPDEQTAGLRLTLTLQDSAGRVTGSFPRGEPVRYVFRVSNTSGETRSLMLPAPFADYVVARSDGAVAWRQSYGTGFDQVPVLWELEPGEALMFMSSWAQRDLAGRLVPPGEYEAWALLPSSPPMLTERMPLRID
jgi:hypothetical protein